MAKKGRTDALAFDTTSQKERWRVLTERQRGKDCRVEKERKAPTQVKARHGGVWAATGLAHLPSEDRALTAKTSLARRRNDKNALTGQAATLDIVTSRQCEIRRKLSKMAPPPAASSSSLRPTKAAHRYRKGQAPAGYRPANEDDESTDEEGQSEEEQLARNARKSTTAAPAPAARRDGLQVINQGAGAAARPIKVQVKTELGAVPKKGEDGNSGLRSRRLRADVVSDASETEESSSEEEESSEEESAKAPPKPVYRAPGSQAPAAAQVKQVSQTAVRSRWAFFHARHAVHSSRTAQTASALLGSTGVERV